MAHQDWSAGTEIEVTGAFQRYGLELRHFLLRRVRRAQDVDDVVQEVFLRLLRVDDAVLVRNPQAYIYGVALHVLREFKLRDLKAGTWMTLEPQAIADMAEHPRELPTEGLAEALDIRQRLHKALARLPLAYRTVFLLHKRDGYSYAEIAQRLKISTHTVDKYLQQARVRIRSMEDL
jgi:RNA polymerase sigma-70 factor (ECF subfamily)